MHELGAMLRKRREAMGATLAEVEAATKIRQKYLAALEADEWQLLPGEVVGRGFLRNYAAYLGLDATEMIERRRAVADPSLASVLATTSAGAPLPPQRDVDYRPKDMPLHDEPDGIDEPREARLGPFLSSAGVVLVVVLLIWGVVAFGDRLGATFFGAVRGVQGWAVAMMIQPTPTTTATGPAQLALDSAAPADGAPEREDVSETPLPPSAENRSMAPLTNTTGLADTTAVTTGAVILPTPTPAVGQPQEPVANTPEPPVDAAAAAPLPTDTPTPTPTPTDTLVALPTDTPTEAPTETPTTPAPVVAAPVCPDARSVLSQPGEGQVIAGDVAVIGRANHEIFQYYKLEFAPAGTENFVYFGGANNIVDGGQLGIFSSGAVPNGPYAIRLTVVDQTGNFPPPCQVNVTVQN
jgi:cytoskeletal protein RodZ